ncbi:MAG: hypothetical protein Q8S73_11040 [Deltaproteobacteria bacterium]|nr:hypothetical protein [Deltaproteobacteria bacterium]
MRKLTVFYSWQSDLSKESNRYALRDALERAAKIVSKGTGIEVEIDEATRNRPGSPDIPATIFSKIELSDVFVCDVTPVTVVASDGRPSPNPNVLLELGYASACLGWGRIVMLFNHHYGESLEKSMPFDLRHRAILGHKLSDYEKGDAWRALRTTWRDRIVPDLARRLREISDTAPARPMRSVNRRPSPEEIKRERDIEMIKRLFEAMPRTKMKALVKSLREGVIHLFPRDDYSIFRVIRDISSEPGFIIHDVKAAGYVAGIVRELGSLLFDYDKWFEKNTAGDHRLPMSPSDARVSGRLAERAAALSSFDASVVLLAKHYDDFVRHIGVNYTEISLDR